jgi:hypothetical protein
MPEISPSRYLVQAGWQDVPHLDETTQRELAASYLPHERDARVKGEPALGSGAIYPVAQSDIECDPFVIPAYWPRAFAMDVGWNRTAVLWGAWDRSVDVMYLYAEHYAGQAVPPVHAEAIKARGPWIPGVIDPAARGRQQGDGEQMIAIYRDLGLNLSVANNTVDAGIYEVWQRMVTGRLKVFRPLQNYWREYRLYRRDEKGSIVKQHDHLMDAMRYLVMSGPSVAKVKTPDRVDVIRPAVGDRQAGY